MRRLKNNTLLFALIVVLLISFFYFKAAQNHYQSITTFKACVDAGFEKLTTYPETCKMPGKIFTNDEQQEAIAMKHASDTAMKIDTTTTAPDFKNLTYSFEGEPIMLRNGQGVIPSNPLSKRGTTTIEVIGPQLLFDITGDSIPDTVFLLRTSNSTSSTSSISYYISSALSLNTGYIGINILPLRTMSASSTFVYKNGEIVLNFLDNATRTTVTKHFILENNLLKEITH